MAVKFPAFRDYLLELFNRTEDEEISYPGYGIDTVSDEGRYPIDTSVSVSVSDTVSDSVSVSEKKKPRTQVEMVDESDLPDEAKDTVKAWLKYKTEKHEGYKEQGLKSLLKQVKKYIDECGIDPVLNRIETAMASGWKGMNLDSVAVDHINRGMARAAPGSDDDPLMKIIRGET